MPANPPRDSHPQSPQSTVHSPSLCAAIILAGGRSTRFGSDKASALLAGRPLLDWAVGAAVQVCPELLIVRAKNQVLPRLSPSTPAPFVVEDEHDALGPLAGMAAGLRATTAAHCFVMSCDAPLVQPALIRMLISLAIESGAEATLSDADGRLQPLLAVYRREPALAAFEAELAAGNLRVTPVVESLRTRRVPRSEWINADPEGDSFRTCNTPEALARIDAHLRARTPNRN